MIDFPSIYWTYATGIGLGANCGKLIDKKLGLKRKGEIKKGVGTDNGYGKGFATEYETGEPISPLAKEFDEAYIRYRPKSAVECILVAMKPVETKSYIEQVMKTGKACTWLDRVRVPVDRESEPRRQDLEPSGSHGYTNESVGFLW